MYLAIVQASCGSPLPLALLVLEYVTPWLFRALMCTQELHRHILPLRLNHNTCWVLLLHPLHLGAAAELQTLKHIPLNKPSLLQVGRVE